MNLLRINFDCSCVELEDLRSKKGGVQRPFSSPPKLYKARLGAKVASGPLLECPWAVFGSFWGVPVWSWMLLWLFFVDYVGCWLSKMSTACRREVNLCKIICWRLGRDRAQLSDMLRSTNERGVCKEPFFFLTFYYRLKHNLSIQERWCSDMSINCWGRRTGRSPLE